MPRQIGPTGCSIGIFLKAAHASPPLELRVAAVVLIGLAAALTVFMAAPLAHADHHTAVLELDLENRTAVLNLDIGPSGMIAADIFSHTASPNRIEVFYPNGTSAFNLLHLRTGSLVAIGSSELITTTSRSTSVVHFNGTILNRLYGLSSGYDNKYNAVTSSSASDIGPSGMIVGLLKGVNGFAQPAVFHPDGILADVLTPYPMNLDDIAIGHSGVIAALDSDHGIIYVFHPNGTHAFRVIADYHARHITVGPRGEIATGGFGGVQVFHPNGTRFLHFDSWSDGSEEFGFTCDDDPCLGYDRKYRQIRDLAFDPSGRLAVVDNPNDGYRYSRIVLFNITSVTTAMPWNPDRPPPAFEFRVHYADHSPVGGPVVQAPPPLTGSKFAFEFGSYGQGAGEFLGPPNVAFGRGGIMAVADRSNDRIQLFHPNGTFAFEFGSRGQGAGEFQGPHAVVFGPNNLLAVSDAGNYRVQVFRLQ